MKCERDLSKKKMIKNTNSKMTTNSKPSTTEPKKTKTKQTTRNEQNHRNGDHMEDYQWEGGEGGWGERYRE